MMEINNLINELHEIKQKEKLLQKELEDLKGKRILLEKSIKSRMDVSEEFANLSEEEFQLLMSDITNNNAITVEVVYALPEKQTIKEIQVTRGSSIEDCLAISEILSDFPEIDLASNSDGIHGMVKPLTDTVQDGDRVEIYRKISAKA
ncbi:MAG: RnfH family protein [Gammaproteobacteria bacterium]